VTYRPQDKRTRLAGALLRDLGAHEQADRRGGPRFLAPTLEVKVKDKHINTIDWGLGALVVRDHELAVAEGAKLVVTLSLPARPDDAHRALVQVLRHDKKRGHLILQFVEISKGLLGWLADLQLTGDAVRL
jgi:hypothetical protein